MTNPEPLGVQTETSTWDGTNNTPRILRTRRESTPRNTSNRDSCTTTRTYSDFYYSWTSDSTTESVPFVFGVRSSVVGSPSHSNLCPDQNHDPVLPVSDHHLPKGTSTCLGRSRGPGRLWVDGVRVVLRRSGTKGWNTVPDPTGEG